MNTMLKREEEIEMVSIVHDNITFIGRSTEQYYRRQR